MFDRFCHRTSLIHILQVDVVCHGQTPVMADVDGSDPYAVSLYLSLSYDVTVFQWITSCHKNRMTTCVLTLLREYVTSLTTSVTTM